MLVKSLVPALGPGAMFMFVLVFLAIHLAAAKNVSPLLRDLTMGGRAGNYMMIKPHYKFRRIPDTDITRQFNAEKRIAADFAQVYFTVRGDGALAYSEEPTDPFGRDSRYAPAVHHICALTICRFDYGAASLAHVAIQYGVFMVSLCLAFWMLNVSRFTTVGVLLVNAYLFLTPAGLSWLERGQFSLYVGAAYLWMMLALIKQREAFASLSAVLGYIKLTSLPFLFVALGTWMIGPHKEVSLSQRMRMAAAFVVPILIAFLLYFDEGVFFLEIILLQEFLSEPRMLSLGKAFPPYLAKPALIVGLVVGVFLIRKCWDDLSKGFPPLLGIGIAVTLFPTKAYAYDLSALLGFVPVLFWWKEIQGAADRYFAQGVMWAFLLFMCLASFAKDYLIFYLCVAFGFLFVVSPAFKFFQNSPNP